MHILAKRGAAERILHELRGGRVDRAADHPDRRPRHEVLEQFAGQHALPGIAPIEQNQGVGVTLQSQCFGSGHRPAVVELFAEIVSQAGGMPNLGLVGRDDECTNTFVNLTGWTGSWDAPEELKPYIKMTAGYAFIPMRVLLAFACERDLPPLDEAI